MRRAAPPPPRLSRPRRIPLARLRWCHFELRTASIVKHSDCLWDLSLHKEGTAIDHGTCLTTLNKGSRPALTSPEQMARELREKKFTHGGDVSVVASLYEQGFVRAFDTYRQYSSSNIVYQNLGRGTAQVPTLVAALEYAEAHCRPKDAAGKGDAKLTLWLKDNKFTAAEKARLRAAIPEGGGECCVAKTKHQLLGRSHTIVTTFKGGAAQRRVGPIESGALWTILL